MTAIRPVHSSRSYQESDPKHHTSNECPHYKELAKNGHVAQGAGGHPLCDWCAKN